MTHLRFETVLDFAKRYERLLATVLFIGGFISDLLTFGFLNLPVVIKIFVGYLIFVVVATIISHVAAGKQENAFGRALSVLGPLLVQFVFGSLLSGFLIFYTKSAVLSVSWPFLILLVLIFFGNEVFRNYRDHLVFQTLLLFFSLYAFAIFALPLYLGRLGKVVFLESTGLAIAAFAIYLGVLALLGWQRLRSAFLLIVITSGVALALIVTAYLSNLLPPIPLTLKSGGIYHSITHVDTGYQLSGEAHRAWFDPRTQLVHHVSDTPLYAYSSIFAPGDFTTTIVHKWQWYDPTHKKWTDEATIAFALSGGREQGYRGYSEKYAPQPGEWRVLVETLDGQILGKLSFTVVNESSEPALITEVR
ncbi:MAG: hypothetical protein JWN90_337 [Parcubacteria group bacterium]|nr:hypothetical protein [Parcubacteria group bacterium]